MVQTGTLEEFDCVIPITFFEIFNIDPDEAGDSWQHGVGTVEFPVVRSQLCSIFTCYLGKKCWDDYDSQVSKSNQ